MIWPDIHEPADGSSRATLVERERRWPEPVDLAPRALAMLAWRHWRENQLCRMMWRRLRPYAGGGGLAMAALTTGCLVATHLLRGSGALGSVGAQLLASLPTSCFSLLVWVLSLFAPVWYGRWAYRLTYAKDDLLRATTMPRTERLLGILVPAIAAVLAYHSLQLPGMWTMGYYSVRYLGGGGMSVAPDGLSMFAYQVSITCALLGGAVTYSLMAATVMLRRLLADVGGFSEASRPIRYVATPFVLGYLVLILTGLVRSVPMFGIIMWFTMNAAAAGGAPQAASPLWVCCWLWGGVVDIAMIPVVCALLRRYWTRDIPRARVLLFQDVPE